MTPDLRRRLGAVAALVAGLFLALALMPLPVTGTVGDALRRWLWDGIGIGAWGLPLLGIGVALAGFDRLARLDMKRAGLFIGGMSVLVPLLVGVVLVSRMLGHRFPPNVESWTWPARAVGLLPALAANGLYSAVGLGGGLLIWFLLLSALTLLTFAWHPLARLERRAVAAPDGVADLASAPDDAVADEAKIRKRRKAVDPLPESEPVDEPEPVLTPAADRARREKKPKKERGAGQVIVIDEESELPPMALLAPPLAHDGDAGEAQLDRLGQSLLETLRTFKVEGTISGRTTGPVVTQFEVVPAAGVKAQKIMALADDLAITMRAPSIRVAPIPGKGAVGVEVPNPKARMVTLRELLESGEWDESRSTLPLALGRDLEGKPVVADLAKMPHLLIAGATGAGKSVAINTIITSLIYRYTPRELRFLMVDPKMVELSTYNELPHLRHKVVTDNKDAAVALKWAVHEMNRRYELLKENGARNLGDFNKKVTEGKTLRNPRRPKLTLTDISTEAADTPPPSPEEDVYKEGSLPYVVVIIDELADLMMTVQGEVETPLAMLAQKARAIGIHLILATQRPSVNVITGLIKANFPSRIAFRVASKVDSRTILDQNGAEALLGNGDMLFLPPGKSEPMRIQGAFIGTEESERVMDWFIQRKEQRRVVATAAADAAPEPQESDILAEMRALDAEGEGKGGDLADGERDALFREAAEACIQNQGGSTSLLQRRLRIGYGRAARIIDQLHYAGILGPPDGSKPREILVGIDQLDEYSK
jgi:S-DNA-T family DNA segregation ATPase FtsK/SpoIIIE